MKYVVREIDHGAKINDNPRTKFIQNRKKYLIKIVSIVSIIINCQFLAFMYKNDLVNLFESLS